MESSQELRSWKEIAAHLGVNVRTAQKWERERGLPVRRAVGARGRVFADAAELTAWKDHLALAPRETECYRWPLATDIIAEVRFLGATPGAEHVERLRQYLELTKAALTK